MFIGSERRCSTLRRWGDHRSPPSDFALSGRATSRTAEAARHRARFRITPKVTQSHASGSQPLSSKHFRDDGVHNVQLQQKAIELIGPPAVTAGELPHRSGFGSSFGASFVAFSRARALVLWLFARESMRRARYRGELRSMSQREIADFCPKLTAAAQEAEKPFWRA
jgi:uncharacterized protein YjiS (DUF1127 family)